MQWLRNEKVELRSLTLRNASFPPHMIEYLYALSLLAIGMLMPIKRRKTMPRSIKQTHLWLNVVNPRTFLHILIAILILSFSTGCQSDSAPSPAAPDVEIKGPFNVLVLNSYHMGYQWSEDIISGIETVFNKGTIRPEIFVEYMDTKRYAPEDIFPQPDCMYASNTKRPPWI